MHAAMPSSDVRIALGIAVVGLLCGPLAADEALPKPTWTSDIQAGPSRFKASCTETECTLELLAFPGQTGWRLTASIPSKPTAKPRIETLSLRGEPRSVHVVVPLAHDRAWEAVVDLESEKPVVAWQGIAGASGPEGEGLGEMLSLEDLSGDGIQDVVVGQVSMGTAVCGQRPALLFPKAYDPKTGRLLPVSLNRFRGLAPAQAAIQAVRKGPIGSFVWPMIKVATPASVSSIEGDEESPYRLDPPWQVLDRDPATFWVEGRPGPGQGEFVTLRIAAEAYPIAAVAIVPSPALPKDGARAFARIKRIDLVVGDQRFEATLPEDPIRRPGEAYWIPLPSPVDAGCVSMVIAEVYPAQAPSQRTGLAEVLLYTSLDLDADPLARVLRDLDDPATRKNAMAALGPVSAGKEDALVAGLAALKGEARAAVLRALATTAPDRVLDVLAQDLASHDAAVRNAAAKSLASAGDAAMPRLIQALVTPGPAATAALEAFRDLDTPAAVSGLIEAIARSPGDEGHLLLLRAALRDAMARVSPENLAAVIPARAADLGQDRRLLVLEALPPGLSGLETWIRDQIRSQLASRRGFDASYRNLRVAGRQLGEKDASFADDFLPYMDDPSDVIRSAAIDALSLWPSQTPPDRLRTLLRDPSPRVRASVLGLAAGLPSCGGGPMKSAIIDLAATDPWPFVRARALDSLDRCLPRHAKAEALAALGDPSLVVRKTAVEILSMRGGPDAMAALTALLTAPEPPPSLKALAALGLGEACWTPAIEALEDLVLEAIRNWGGPGFDDAGFAAVTALSRLGGPKAREALEIAIRRGPPPLQKAALTAQGGKSRCENDRR